MLKRASKKIQVLAGILVSMWAVFAVSQVVSLHRFGIHPRQVYGLPGLLCAPFIHANIYHIFNNSLLILVFGFVYSLIERRHLGILFGQLAVLGGAMTWLMGSRGVHIGASGVVFGLWSHMIFRGWYHRKFKYICVAAGLLFFYGSLIYGVLPTNPYISWESHLSGLLAGMITARFKPREDRGG